LKIGKQPDFRRPAFGGLRRRLLGARRFLQVLVGPRQTGKTTLALQVMEKLEMPSHYATADEPALKDLSWIEQQWEVGRLVARSGGRRRRALLVLDEIQKIPGWSETVKRLWDEDTAARLPLRVILLGSSALLVQQGLSDSLAGRFEVVRLPHWSFSEMREAFGWGVDEFVFYGGYPGGAPLIREPLRWASYITDSLVETTLSRDILLMTRVHKPALLRRLFELGCAYSGQVLSYQKMLGQLQDAGNTTTLAHYLDLLRSAGLLAGLPKYAGQRVRRRASSPKLQVLNTALLATQTRRTLSEARKDPELWGRFVESAAGAALANGVEGTQIELHYWSSRNREVDFVLARGGKVVAIEVKSGRKKGTLPGMEAFSREFRIHRKLLVGTSGIPLDEFLQITPESLLR
jgi:predicted AAA+ superfamily ATPase